MSLKGSSKKTTDTNPAYRTGRQMSWAMVGFFVLILALKFIS